MEGVTHPELRRLIASYGGVGLVCTEFIRITAAPPSPRHLASLVVRDAATPLSVQVMGKHLQHMARATQIVAQAGADVIDINLGCPAPKAVRKGVGSAMLKDMALLQQVVGHMRSHTRGPLSAKMRAGFDDAEHALEIGQVLQSAGVDFVTVHPRRRVDFFHGRADYRIAAAIKRELRIPVIVNGDLWYAADARRTQQETGCDGVMLGRPALRNPWIFAQLLALEQATVPPAPDGACLLAHLEAFIAATRPRFPRSFVGLVKEQLRYLLAAVPGGSQLSRSLLRLTEIDDLRRRLSERLARVEAGELDLGTERNPDFSNT